MSRITVVRARKKQTNITTRLLCSEWNLAANLRIGTNFSTQSRGTVGLIRAMERIGEINQQNTRKGK